MEYNKIFKVVASNVKSVLKTTETLVYMLVYCYLCTVV